MKYFTPERYVALQDFSSDAAMNAADAAWEREAAAYESYFHSVEAALPAEFRRLQQDFYLHDAIVLYMGRQNERFIIALQLDPPPRQILELSYELTGPPRIDRTALPEPFRGTAAADWMYDEIDLIASAAPSFVHSILFGNGWEVQIPFTILRLEEVQAVLPMPVGQLAPSAPESQVV